MQYKEIAGGICAPEGGAFGKKDNVSLLLKSSPLGGAGNAARH